jgi:hypothetical protein
MYLNASMTVEACLLMPIVLGVVFSLIIAALVFHDAALVNSYVREMAIDMHIQGMLDNSMVEEEKQYEISRQKILMKKTFIFMEPEMTSDNNKLFIKSRVSAGKSITDPLAGMFLNKKISADSSFVLADLSPSFLAGINQDKVKKEVLSIDKERGNLRGINQNKVKKEAHYE